MSKLRKEKPRGAMGNYTCACGKSFTARVADRNRGWARFCSKACAKKLGATPVKPKTKDYPNERDCEHGLLRGKCESCDLAQAEQRIAELEEKNAHLEHIQSSHDQVWKELGDMIHQRDELSATVERLRNAIEYCTSYLDENKLNTIGSRSKAHNELHTALQLTPQQSLAEHDAEVARKAFEAGAKWWSELFNNISCSKKVYTNGASEAANEYAKRIKDGER